MYIITGTKHDLQYMYVEWKHFARLSSLVVQIKSARDLKGCSKITESYETKWSIEGVEST